MNAEVMAPNELATAVIIGLRLRANPAGIAIHNSSIPSKKTVIIDIKYSKMLIFNTSPELQGFFNDSHYFLIKYTLIKYNLI